MEPTKKSFKIDSFLTRTFGIDRQDSILHNKCTMYGKEAKVFKDEIIKKEFTVSGICQVCQDKVFG
jgi:hypothetical protein